MLVTHILFVAESPVTSDLTGNVPKFKACLVLHITSVRPYVGDVEVVGC